MIYFTSDQHFRHENIIKYCKRPFKTVDEMDQAMIKAWNETVCAKDTVYMLGDFCMEKLPTWLELIPQLNGEIILIKGNHDRRKVIDKVLELGLIKELYLKHATLQVGSFTLVLSHKPDKKLITDHHTYNIHGHIHDDEEANVQMINVCVDSTLAKQNNKPFGTPIALNDLMRFIEDQEWRIYEESFKMP